MGNQIKPCPFCNGEARMTQWLRGYWIVAKHVRGCPINDMEPPLCAYYTSQDAALRAWNMRDVK